MSGKPPPLGAIEQAGVGDIHASLAVRPDDLFCEIGTEASKVRMSYPVPSISSWAGPTLTVFPWDAIPATLISANPISRFCTANSANVNVERCPVSSPLVADRAALLPSLHEVMAMGRGRNKTDANHKQKEGAPDRGAPVRESRSRGAHPPML